MLLCVVIYFIASYSYKLLKKNSAEIQDHIEDFVERTHDEEALGQIDHDAQDDIVQKHIGVFEISPKRRAKLLTFFEGMKGRCALIKLSVGKHTECGAPCTHCILTCRVCV